MQVYKGELLGMYGDNNITKVAIKTLKENSSPKVQTDFRREIDLMSEMRHPNIVCLLGVCTRQEPMSMLFEYMVQGDLHEYLIKHSPHSDISVVEETHPGGSKILEYPDMLHISTQVKRHLLTRQFDSCYLTIMTVLTRVTSFPVMTTLLYVVELEKGKVQEIFYM